MRFVALFLLFFAPATVFATEAQQQIDIPASESEEAVDDAPVEFPAKDSQHNEPISAKEKEKIKEKEKTKKPAASKPEENPKPETAGQEAPLAESNIVILQGLNKVTGRVYSLEAMLGTVSRFETLEIIARYCAKSKTNEPPENSALLEIREVKTKEEPKQVFLGWMFSSSPSLFALEHPVYDITVLSCEARIDPEGNAQPAKN